jgi:hypothetical protein
LNFGTGSGFLVLATTEGSAISNAVYKCQGNQ